MKMLKARAVPEIKPVPVRETELGPMYWVIIHNDEVTPMDFVIHILERIFQITGPTAIHIMLTAHYNGSAYVQRLPKDEAQKRIRQAHFAARVKGYPLQFSIEPEK